MAAKQKQKPDVLDLASDVDEVVAAQPRLAADATPRQVAAHAAKLAAWRKTFQRASRAFWTRGRV